MVDRALGRLPAQPSRPRLSLSSHLLTELPPQPPPDQRDYMSKVTSWPMYLNDRLGDCTCAAPGHMIQAETTYATGTTVTISDDAVLKAYEAVSGYDPSTGANDNGAVLQDVLDLWRKTGIGGHKILAFAEVDLADNEAIDAAINLFGGIYVGVWLPKTAETQIDAGQPWDVSGTGPDSASGSWGGHAIHIGRYDDPANTMICTTWGDTQPLTEAFFQKYVDEAWVVITQDWLDKNGNSPGGLDLYGLGEQFAALTGQANPFPEPTPAPTPVDPADPDHVMAAAAHIWLTHRVRLTWHKDMQAATRKWLTDKGL